MAGPTHGEKIDELPRVVNNLVARIDAIHAELKRETERHELELQRQTERHEAITRVVEEVRVAAAVVRRDVDDLRKSQDEWGRRLWALFSPLLGVAIGAIVTYLLRR
jgi:hypothetical protein